VPDTLPVHLNRQDRHSLEVPPSFETADSFVIAVNNHGEAGRLHVHLDDGLPEIATIEDTNFYVAANGVTEIPVSVHGTDHVYGKLKVVSGYGAVTRWIDVEVTEPDSDDTVEIDEDLGKPKHEDDESGSSGPGALVGEHPLLPVAGLGLLALLVVVGAMILFESTVVVGGAVLVVGAVLVASYLLLQ